MYIETRKTCGGGEAKLSTQGMIEIETELAEVSGR